MLKFSVLIARFIWSSWTVVRLGNGRGVLANSKSICADASNEGVRQSLDERFVERRAAKKKAAGAAFLAQPLTVVFSPCYFARLCTLGRGTFLNFLQELR